MALLLKIRPNEDLARRAVVQIPLSTLLTQAMREHGYRQKCLPPAVVAEILRLWGEGATPSRIAICVGASESTVRAHIHRSGLFVQRQQSTHYGRVQMIFETRGAELRERYEAGETISNLAGAVGISPTTLRKHFRDFGVDIPPIRNYQRRFNELTTSTERVEI